MPEQEECCLSFSFFRRPRFFCRALPVLQPVQGRGCPVPSCSSSPRFLFPHCCGCRFPPAFCCLSGCSFPSSFCCLFPRFLFLLSLPPGPDPACRFLSLSCAENHSPASSPDHKDHNKSLHRDRPCRSPHTDPHTDPVLQFRTPRQKSLLRGVLPPVRSKGPVRPNTQSATLSSSLFCYRNPCASFLPEQGRCYPGRNGDRPESRPSVQFRNMHSAGSYPP